MKGVTLCKQGCQAMADTGSSALLGPKDQIAELNRLIGVKLNPFTKINEVPCALRHKMPTFNIKIKGRNFPINPYDYIAQVTIRHILRVY